MLSRLLCLAFVMLLPGAAFAQSANSFTYQGQLGLQGQPYSGSADLRFTLWSQAIGGSPLAAPISVLGIEVSQGLFSVSLDFNVQHTPGQHLQIEVRTPAWDGVGVADPFFSFDERVRLGASPYSLNTRGITTNAQGTLVAIGSGQPPRAHLDIDSNDAVTLAILDSGNANTGVSAIDFYDRGNAVWGLGKDFGNDFYIDRVGLGTALFLDLESGFLGVGLRNPSSRLAVAGGVRARGGEPGPFGSNDNGYAFAGDGGDDDTGMYSTGNGVLQFYVNAAEALRLETGAATLAGSLSATGEILAEDLLATGDVIAGGRVSADTLEGELSADNVVHAPASNTPQGTRPIHFVYLNDRNGGFTYASNFPAAEWRAAVVGLSITSGDVQETGVGDVLIAYPFENIGGTWSVRFDARTHNGTPRYDAVIMFVSNSLASWGTP